jgi:3-dehydrotetronate 4-kinase
MLRLGCITDDVGMACALAGNLMAGGMRVMQTRGVPNASLEAPVDAAVVALKTRTIPPKNAISQVLDALVWLKIQGAEQIYFCFSPTFDSIYTGETPGNIGPVVEALMAALDTDFTVVVPAYPDRDITLLKGHLFVGQLLLHESGMERHSKTPMTDANLMRVLQAQTKREVALINHVVVGDSSVTVQEHIVALRLKHIEVALVDATSNEDLLRIADAVKNLPLVAGSPGMGLGLPHNFGFFPSAKASRLPITSGTRAVICGVCNDVSRLQVQVFHAEGHPAMALDPLKVAKFGVEKVTQAALAWATPLLKSGPVLFYSGATAASLAALKSLMDVSNGQEQIDMCFAEITLGLVERNVRQLIVSGTETGALCLRSMDVQQMQVGPEIGNDVHWYYSQLPNDPDNGLHFLVLPDTLEQPDIFTSAFNWMR